MPGRPARRVMRGRQVQRVMRGRQARRVRPGRQVRLAPPGRPGRRANRPHGRSSGRRLPRPSSTSDARVECRGTAAFSSCARLSSWQGPTRPARRAARDARARGHPRSDACRGRRVALSAAAPSHTRPWVLPSPRAAPLIGEGLARAEPTDRRQPEQHRHRLLRSIADPCSLSRHNVRILPTVPARLALPRMSWEAPTRHCRASGVAPPAARRRDDFRCARSSATNRLNQRRRSSRVTGPFADVSANRDRWPAPAVRFAAARISDRSDGRAS